MSLWHMLVVAYASPIKDVEISVYLTRLLNLSLRGITLLCKFILIFFLAKFLDPADLGVYGLLMAAVAYSLFFAGMEFYTYSTRELIGAGEGSWLRMVRDQSLLFVMVYAVFLPLSLVLFVAGWLPWSLFFWFVVLLVLEHVAQEMNRIFVAMSRPLLAGMILFIRSGLWGVIAIAAMALYPSLRQVETVFFMWCLGSLAGCVLGGVCLLGLSRDELCRKVDWSWIKTGLKIAFPLFIAGLAVRGLFTFDRFFVESLGGLEILGVYVLFVGITNAVIAFLDAGVVVFYYPKLVGAFKNNDANGFYSGMKSLGLNVLVITAFLVAGSVLGIGYLLDWLDNPIYQENLSLLYWLLLAVTLYCVSLIPHLGLYAMGKDYSILVSQVSALFVFLVSVFWFSNSAGVLAVPMALCAAFSALFVWKLCVYMLIRKTLLVAY